MWYAISFYQNYYLKPNPVPHQFNDPISIQEALRLFPSTETQNNLEWILFCKNRLPPSSVCFLKMQTVNSSETLLPRPHVILTYTTLFIHHCEKLKKKPSGWFMQKKLKYRNHIMFWTNIAWCNVTKLPPHLSYSFHCLIKWNNKEKGYNKYKSCKPTWNAKCTKKNSNNKSQIHLQLKMTNSKSYCFSQHKWFSKIYLWTNCTLNFKMNLNYFTLKSHTLKILLLKVLQM